MLLLLLIDVCVAGCQAVQLLAKWAAGAGGHDLPRLSLSNHSKSYGGAVAALPPAATTAASTAATGVRTSTHMATAFHFLISNLLPLAFPFPFFSS